MLTPEEAGEGTTGRDRLRAHYKGACEEVMKIHGDFGALATRMRSRFLTLNQR